MVQLVAAGMVVGAFRAEAERLSETVSGTDEACFTRPSPCPPWTAGELLYHVRIAVGRVPGMLTEPEPAGGPLVSAADYTAPQVRKRSRLYQARRSVLLAVEGACNPTGCRCQGGCCPLTARQRRTLNGGY